MKFYITTFVIISRACNHRTIFQSRNLGVEKRQSRLEIRLNSLPSEKVTFIFYTGVILLLNRLTVFYVSSESSRLLQKLGCFILTVLVKRLYFMGPLIVLWVIFVPHGGRVSEEFETCPIKHMAICCPFSVAACLSLTSFA